MLTNFEKQNLVATYLFLVLFQSQAAEVALSLPPPPSPPKSSILFTDYKHCYASKEHGRWNETRTIPTPINIPSPVQKIPRP